MTRMLTFPYTFVLMNWAAVVGLYYFATGKKDIWLKHRSAHNHQR